MVPAVLIQSAANSALESMKSQNIDIKDVFLKIALQVQEVFEEDNPSSQLEASLIDMIVQDVAGNVVEQYKHENSSVDFERELDIFCERFARELTKIDFGKP